MQRSKILGPTARMLVTLAVLACGDGNTPMDEAPIDEDPAPVPPEVEGSAIYALDRSNRLLLFGTESTETIGRIVPISGVPILSRIVDIKFRPSTGELYGVGNDSRVYIIDPETGQAAPVSPSQFEPRIASFFEIHFGMAFDPVTERIRLLSAEGGLNWSIDPDDGTAVAGPRPHVAAGDPNEGVTLHLAGIVAVPPGAGTGTSALVAGAASSAQCEIFDALFIAIDPDLGALFSTCDPDASEWKTLGKLEGLFTRCAALDLPGSDDWPKLSVIVVRDGEQVFLEVDISTVGPEGLEPFFNVKLLGTLPVDSPIQGFGFLPGSSSSHAASVKSAEIRAWDTRGSLSNIRMSHPPDLRTQCTGAGGN